jgi:hypothetical protein
MVRLCPDFVLREFTPRGLPDESVPVAVVGNLGRLCLTVLQPERTASGVPTIVTSGWRPPDLNAAAGGVRGSDHLSGGAVDFRKASGGDQSWEQNTRAAYRWIALHCFGDFGQLIYEDHRIADGRPGRLWIHVSLPTLKHQGGENDRNRLLVSFASGHYEPYTDALEPLP